MYFDYLSTPEGVTYSLSAVFGAVAAVIIAYLYNSRARGLQSNKTLLCGVLILGGIIGVGANAAFYHLRSMMSMNQAIVEVPGYESLESDISNTWSKRVQNWFGLTKPPEVVWTPEDETTMVAPQHNDK